MTGYNTHPASLPAHPLLPQAGLSLNKQPLLCPRPLHLPPLDDMLLRDNLHLFRAYGFDFVEAPVAAANGGQTGCQTGGMETDMDADISGGGSGSLMLSAVPYSK